MKLFLVLVVACATVNCNPVPRMLTEEQFLSSSNVDEDSKTVDIVSGYAQIRRQGRNFGVGEKFKFSRPVTVRDPSEFQPPVEAKRVTFDDEKAPVFNLNQILTEEAEKLKIQVEVASLMAAHAAEETAARISSMAEEAIQEGLVDAVQVDKIIEEAVDSGIHEAEEIVKSELDAIKPEVEEIKPEVEEIKPEVEEIKPEVEEIKPEVEEIKPEVEGIKPEVEEIKPEVEEIKPEVEEIKPEVEEIKPEVEEIKPEVEEIKPEVEEIKPEVEEIKPEVEEIKSEDVEIKPEVEEIKSEDVEIKPEVEEIKPEVEEIKPEVEEIKIEVEEQKPEETDTVKPDEISTEKNANVEWAQEDPISQENPTELVQEVLDDIFEIQEKEQADKPEEEAVLSVDDLSEAISKSEIAETTISSDGESAKSGVTEDLSNVNGVGVTTDSSHPPQDLDLGSVQEVQAV